MDQTRRASPPECGPSTPSPTAVRCPWCEVTLPVDALACRACHLPLTGSVAVALWETDRDLAALRLRRAHLMHQLRNSTARPDPAAPADAPRFSSHAPAATVAPDVSAAVDPTRRSWTGQQLLLGTGALLLVVAAVVFLAVAWSVIGVVGQVGVMAVVTALVAATSLYSARRRLAATAETLSILTVALFVVDAGAAYSLDLAGLSGVDTAAYSAVVAGMLTVGCLGAATAAPSVWSYRLAAVGAAASAPLLALSAANLSPVSTALLLLVGAVGFGGSAGRLPGPWVSIRIPVTIAATGYVVLTWAQSISGLLDGDLLGTGGLAALIGLVATGGAGVVAGLHRGFGAARRHWLLSVVALPLFAVTIVTAATRVGTSGLTVLVLACVAAVYAAALGLSRVAMRTHPLGVGVAVAYSVYGFALILGQLDASDQLATRTPIWAVLTSAYLLGAVAAALTARRHPGLRTGAVGCACGLGLAAVFVGVHPSGTSASSIAGTVAAMALAGIAAWHSKAEQSAGRRTDTEHPAGRWGQPEELVFGVAWSVTVLLALGLAFTAPTTIADLAAATLAAAGLTAFAYALLPHRGLLALLGAVSSSAAVWTVLIDRDVATLEAYTVPFALLLGVIGLVRWRRDRSTPSWLSVGPMLAVGLLPSALASVADAGVVRPLLVLGVSAVILVAGVALRWQAPVVIGALGLLIVSVAQLAPYAVGLPRWLSFGTIGLALLVLGARYEQRRRNAWQAARWVTALR